MEEKTAREMALEVKDGVITWNGDPACISDLDPEEIRNEIDDAVSVEIMTPDNTDEWEWEVLCSRLDLTLDDACQRIFVLCDLSGAMVCHFASIYDYDKKIRPLH